MVVGTTRDPATPYSWAEAPRPTSSTPGCWSRRDGDGHTGYNAGNDCVDGAVEGYLIDGTVPRGRPVLLTPLCNRAAALGAVS